MKIVVITIIFTFLSCTSVRQREKYFRIVNRTDRITIDYRNDSTSIELLGKDLNIFKDILTRNIEVEFARKFAPDIQIHFYQGSTRLALLKISYNADNGFVNVHAGDTIFGFKLTYGIGRFLAEINHPEPISKNTIRE